MKYGGCKECENNRIPIDETTQIVGQTKDSFSCMGIIMEGDYGVVYELWECPTCGHPHDINDFMGVYEE